MFSLDNEIVEAYEGREIWLSIKKQYSMTNNSGLVIFASTNQELNNVAREIIPVYKEVRKLDKIVTLSIEEPGIDKVLSYYRAIRFFKNTIVVSLDEPYGNDYFMKNTDIDLYEFVKVAIFKLR